MTVSKTLRWVPSIQCSNCNQQASEGISDYMQPAKIDGQPFFLFGVRRTLAEPFSFLRIPCRRDGQWTTAIRGCEPFLLDLARWDRL